MKFVFSAKIWFMKTSTRIVNYESQVTKLNPGNPEYLEQNKNHLEIQISNIIPCWNYDGRSMIRIRPDDGRSISRNVAHLNILVHDMINLLYYEY